MSICSAVMPVARAGDLEVHVAEVVLVAEDVGEDGHAVALLDQAHGDAGHRRLERHPGVHQRQSPAAHRGHRGGAVRLEGLGHDADRVRELLEVGQHRLEGALGEVAVPHLAPPRPAQHARLADREGREVVVQVEALARALGEGVDRLLVAVAAQGGEDHRLGLAAREQRHAVGARDRPHLTGDRPDLVGLAAVDARPIVEDALAHQLRAEVVQGLLDGALEAAQCRLALLDRRQGVQLHRLVAEGGDEALHHLLLDGGDRGVALVLGADRHRLGQLASA